MNCYILYNILLVYYIKYIILNVNLTSEAPINYFTLKVLGVLQICLNSMKKTVITFSFWRNMIFSSLLQSNTWHWHITLWPRTVFKAQLLNICKISLKTNIPTRKKSRHPKYFTHCLGTIDSLEWVLFMLVTLYIIEIKLFGYLQFFMVKSKYIDVSF